MKWRRIGLWRRPRFPFRTVRTVVLVMTFRRRKFRNRGLMWLAVPFIMKRFVKMVRIWRTVPPSRFSVMTVRPMRIVMKWMMINCVPQRQRLFAWRVWGQVTVLLLVTLLFLFFIIMFTFLSLRVRLNVFVLILLLTCLLILFLRGVLTFILSGEGRCGRKNLGSGGPMPVLVMTVHKIFGTVRVWVTRRWRW